MALIKLQRSSEYNNMMRDYHIYIDNKKAGTIANGELKTFEISGGNHSVIAKIDWCSSKKVQININDDDQLILKVGGFKIGKWMLPIGLSLILLHFALEYFLDIDFIKYLIMAASFVLVYFITFGRKRYLYLEKIS